MNCNKRIITVFSVICVLLLSLTLFLTYFEVFRADKVIKSSYNKRIWENEDSVVRGSIMDRTGTILALSENKKRRYPFKDLYTHVIGYNSRTYGKTNLELTYNTYLTTEYDLLLHSDEKNGASLVLSIDHGLTKVAQQALGSAIGSAVAINPKTGEVLCLYSNPTFDANEDMLIKNWPDLSEDDNSPFLARATKGLYPPGSTFKTIIAVSAVKNGLSDYTVNDEGKVKIDGKEFKNYDGHIYGELDLKKGFAKSSNVMFCSLATELGEKNVKSVTGDFMVGKEIDFDLSLSQSKFPYTFMSKTDLASVGMGQGKILVTPLNMALVASAVANDGVMMKPYLVQTALSKGGKVVYSARPSVLSTAFDKSITPYIKEYMAECCKTGTGTGARIPGIEVCGKTGTAENATGKDHSWFIAFAPKDNPEIAVAVMMESCGKSGSACCPIAKKMINYWLFR